MCLKNNQIFIDSNEMLLCHSSSWVDQIAVKSRLKNIVISTALYSGQAYLRYSERLPGLNLRSDYLVELIRGNEFIHQFHAEMDVVVFLLPLAVSLQKNWIVLDQPSVSLFAVKLVESIDYRYFVVVLLNKLRYQLWIFLLVFCLLI